MTATRGLRISDCEFRISLGLFVAFWFSAIHLVLRFTKFRNSKSALSFPVRLATHNDGHERIANFGLRISNFFGSVCRLLVFSHSLGSPLHKIPQFKIRISQFPILLDPMRTPARR